MEQLYLYIVSQINNIMWKKNEVTFIRFQVTTGAWFKIKNGIIFIELFAWKVEDNNIMWTWSQMEGRAGGWWNKIFIRIFGSTFYTCQLFLIYRCDIFILRVPGLFLQGSNNTWRCPKMKTFTHIHQTSDVSRLTLPKLQFSHIYISG